jgi:hypothetical protein
VGIYSVSGKLVWGSGPVRGVAGVNALDWPGAQKQRYGGRPAVAVLRFGGRSVCRALLRI